ncbi:hypothetical protein P9E05_01980 [Bacillus mojavensis]|uniref:hypothetical protein n=2 Tax=Bacillus TaxID=1386 RepID=UPI002DBA207D|nr:hypothetical protein [Bacillus mojavensis]MEC1690294.1 hypothetical protein [Bacillus mojavensis]
MSNVFIRSGNTRENFSMVYHELFDLYHGYIGDKATLYYTFLLRYRHNREDSEYGKSWRGRKGVAEKFNLSYSTLKILDAILKEAGLVEIETKPSGRGRDKIVYIVNDPLDREKFRWAEPKIAEALKKIAEEIEGAESLFGKEFRAKLTEA